MTWRLFWRRGSAADPVSLDDLYCTAVGRKALSINTKHPLHTDEMLHSGQRYRWSFFFFFSSLGQTIKLKVDDVHFSCHIEIKHNTENKVKRFIAFMSLTAESSLDPLRWRGAGSFYFVQMKTHYSCLNEKRSTVQLQLGCRRTMGRGYLCWHELITAMTDSL